MIIDSEYLEGNGEIISKLRQIPVLRSLDERELQDLLAFSELREYKSGKTILQEGTADSTVYYLVSGQVKIMKKGKELLALRRTGDVFGEIGVIAGSSRSASVVAKTDSVCLAADSSKLDSLTEKDRMMFRYMLYWAFAEILANRLKFTTEELTEARDEIERLERLNN